MGTERRTFFGPDIDVSSLAHALADTFSSEGYEVQVLPDAGSGTTVQARKEDTLRRIAGMSSALTMVLGREGENVFVDVGGAHWVDKGIAAGVGAVLFFPALITAGIGAYQQNHLNKEAWQIVEDHILAHGGKGQSAPDGVTNSPAPASATQCANPQCRQLLPPGARFCAACGTVVARHCMNCGEELESGAGHCAKCGSAVTD
jgi:hypothetical protein